MRFSIMGATALLLLSTAASAESYDGVAFAGGSASGGVSGYAGIVRAFPGSRLGNGLALRGALAGGSYEYESNGLAIDGKFASAEAALVYQFSGDWGWANVSAGPRLSDVSLSPADPANDREGTRLDLALQSDGGFQLGHSWRLGWLGSFGVLDGAYYSRADLGAVVDARSQTRLGAEAGLQGDPRYRAISLGLFASTRLGSDLEGRVAFGATDQEGRKAQPYGSAGVSLLF